MSHKHFIIEKHIHGGFGLCRNTEGKITLLTGGITGEEVAAKIHPHTKTLQQGRVVKVLNPSSARKQPPCSYYPQCGGCDFQHIQYAEQLQIKMEVIKDLLTRSGTPTLNEAAQQRLLPPIPSEKHFHYRQRIRLQVDKEQNLGFFKRRSNSCIPITHCLLAKEAINNCLQTLSHHPPLRQLLPRMEALEILFNPGSNRIFCICHMVQKPRPADLQKGKQIEETVEEVEQVIFAGKTFAPTATAPLSCTISPVSSYTGHPLDLSWETGGFCQVNLEQNQHLIETVLTYCDCTKQDKVLDLFCGMGNFSIPLACNAKTVMGIEGQGAAIRSAKQNSIAAQLSNTLFQKRPVHKAAEELVAEGKEFDIVVIDPPRQGAPELAGALAKLTKKRLVYISCDPATLCRDLTALLENGFQLVTLQPIDMFPQTHHIECVALLVKSPEKH